MATLLKYMYTDIVEKDQITAGLLCAANKYELMLLMDICQEHLSTTLDVNNVADIFEVAYLQDAKELKKHAISFMA